MESPNIDSPDRSPNPVVGKIAAVFIVVLLLIAVLLVLIPNYGRSPDSASVEEFKYIGIASVELQQEGMKLLMEQEAKLGCEDVSMTGVEVLNLPQDVLDASWAEVWDVNACGVPRSYAVNFTTQAEGDILVEVFGMQE